MLGTFFWNWTGTWTETFLWEVDQELSWTGNWAGKSGLRQHHVRSNYAVCLILACIGNGNRAGSLVLEWNENWTESSLLDLNWEVQLYKLGAFFELDWEWELSFKYGLGTELGALDLDWKVSWELSFEPGLGNELGAFFWNWTWE